RRIGTIGDAAEDADRRLARLFRCPGRAVAADLVPALAPVLSAVEHGIGDGRPALAARMKAGYRGIPDDFAGAERAHLPQPDPLLLGHPVPPAACLLLAR